MSDFLMFNVRLFSDIFLLKSEMIRTFTVTSRTFTIKSHTLTMKNWIFTEKIQIFTIKSRIFTVTSKRQTKKKVIKPKCPSGGATAATSFVENWVEVSFKIRFGDRG